MVITVDDDYLGAVIRIIDYTSLLIDVGRDRLSVGDVVQVYEAGEPILNKEGNKIGYYHNIKDTLEIVRVEQNFSECKKIPDSSDKSLLDNISVLATSPLIAKKKTSLNIQSDDIKELEKIKDPVIHIGDPVRKVY